MIAVVRAWHKLARQCENFSEKPVPLRGSGVWARCRRLERQLTQRPTETRYAVASGADIKPTNNMAWRDFYAVNQQQQPLVETTMEKIDEAAALASVAPPIIVPPVETVLAPDVTVPTTSLLTESGVACRVEGSAMPSPVVSDGSKLCSRVHRFLGKSML